MENNHLENIWMQKSEKAPAFSSKQIIEKATAHRRNQNIGIVVLIITVAIVTAYGIWQFPQKFNTFTAGLLLMVVPLIVRIGIELNSKLTKATKLVQLDTRSYKSYLTKHFAWRKVVHLVITPICFTLYIVGLCMLFPYFKNEFSQGFYIYLIVSAVISLAVVAIVIIKQVRKELSFLTTLQGE